MFDSTIDRMASRLFDTRTMQRKWVKAVEYLRKQSKTGWVLDGRRVHVTVAPITVENKS